MKFNEDTILIVIVAIRILVGMVIGVGFAIVVIHFLRKVW